MTPTFAARGKAWLLTGGLCFLSGRLAYGLVGTDLAPAIFWPPAGIALGAALLWGISTVPAAFLGIAAAVALAGAPAPTALFLGLATAIQAAAGAYLLRRTHFSTGFAQVADLIKLLLLGGLVAGLLAAPITYHALVDVEWFWEATFAQAALATLFAHSAAALVFALLMLCWREDLCPKQSAGRLELTLASLGLILTSLVLSHASLFGMHEGVFRPYPILPFLLWLALRADIRLTALGVAWTYAIAASTAGWGRGDLYTLLPDATLMPIHGFIMVVALSISALAILMAARVRMENALRNSEARFRNTLDLTRNCMWELDAQGRFSFVDQHADSVLGKSAGHLLGRRPEDIWPSGLGDAWHVILRRALDSLRAETAVNAVQRENSGTVWLETSCVPQLDESGRIQGWQGITRDISDRVQMARDLNETDRRFRQLAENIQEVFWVSERFERFLYISPQCEAVLGIPPQRLYADSMAWFGLIHEADQVPLHQALECLSTRQNIDLECRIRHPLKGLRWIWIRAFPIEEDGGPPMNAGILEDITHRKLVEQTQLEQAIAQKDVLIREVHHRIKNNLQTVVGLLRREAGKHPEAKASIESAITQVQSVAVVHGLHGRVTQHTIMLCELLPAIVGSVSELTGVTIQREGIPEGCGELRIKDSETVAVALILNELATNAVKHAGDDHRVRPPWVSLKREDQAGCIRMVNPGRLPDDFDFANGQGLGAGLGLVRLLAPTPGVSIGFRQADGLVEVDVRIEAPVLTPALSNT